MPLPHITESIIFFVPSRNCIPKHVKSKYKSSRNESNTLKYSTRPRQVILFPLISLISRLSGLSSQGMSIFKFLMNSSSISTSKSKFIIILKILSNSPCPTIKQPLISSISSLVTKSSLTVPCSKQPLKPTFLRGKWSSLPKVLLLVFLREAIIKEQFLHSCLNTSSEVTTEMLALWRRAWTQTITAWTEKTQITRFMMGRKNNV